MCVCVCVCGSVCVCMYSAKNKSIVRSLFFFKILSNYAISDVCLQMQLFFFSQCECVYGKGDTDLLKFISFAHNANKG